MLSGLT